MKRLVFFPSIVLAMSATFSGAGPAWVSNAVKVTRGTGSKVAINGGMYGTRTVGPRSVLPEFRVAVDQLSKKTSVPILLPSRFFDLDPGQKLYLWELEARTDLYELSLDFVADCRGAGACYYGYIAGRKANGRVIHGTPNFPFERRRARAITLRGGRKGWFTETTCGANCGPSSIYWIENGYEFGVGIKAASRADVLKLTNNIIANMGT